MASHAADVCPRPRAPIQFKSIQFPPRIAATQTITINQYPRHCPLAPRAAPAASPPRRRARAAAMSDGDARASLVAHVVVVGFHAALGNRIEFAYPRLRGDTQLRSPKLSDTSDISDPSPGSPAAPRALSSRPALTTSAASASASASPTTAAADDAACATAGAAAAAAVPAPSPAPAPAPAPSVEDEVSLLRLGSGGIASARTPPAPGASSATPDRRFGAAGSTPPLPPASAFATPESRPRRAHAPPASPAAAVGDWGALPRAWAHLPFMAIPDGAHEVDEDVVFFSLPPDVHCVSCFRQGDAIDAVNHSASTSTRAVEARTAARGSVQKSVVLLCRRPLFGFLAARLVPAVRRYFHQADFARTDALADLFHELNVSLADPRMRMRSTLWRGVSLSQLLLKVGPQTLAVVKLLLLEKRVVFYSQPVARSSEAVVALASLFPGALDSISPNMPPLDTAPDDTMHALPLALFGARDRVRFQPYAPLPVVSELLRERGGTGGCLIGTSRNVGVLLAATAANAARKAAAASAAATQAKAKALATAAISSFPLRSDASSLPSVRQGSNLHAVQSTSARKTKVAAGDGENRSDRAASSPNLESVALDRSGSPPPNGPGTMQRSSSSRNMGRSNGGAQRPSEPISSKTTASVSAGIGSGPSRLPVVDALVNLTTGKVSVASAIEPQCRITRQERRLMKDLMVAASAPLPVSENRSVEEGEGETIEPTSDDYIRARIREYFVSLLCSVAAVPGVLGGPCGGETWSAEMAAHLDTSHLVEYNPLFVSSWLQTRNASFWARRCESSVAALRPVPLPELDMSLIDEALLPVERVVSGLNGLRENVALASSRAAEGLSSLFSHLEGQIVRMSSPAGRPAPGRPQADSSAARPSQSSELPVARSLGWSQSAPAVVGGKASQSEGKTIGR